MSAAQIKNPPAKGGLQAEQIALSVYSISKKHEVVKDQIIRMRQRLNLEIEDWRRFAIFTARVFLNFAPAEIRARFTGRPSETPREVVELCETFLLLYAIAEDKAKATDTKYSLIDIWQAAVQLAGVTL